MTRFVLPEALDAINGDLLDLSTATLKLLLCLDGYNPAGDVFLADIPGGSQVGLSDPLTTVTFDDGGHVYGDPALVQGVAGGIDVGSFWLLADTGVPATSRLICWTDERSDTSAILFTTPGTDILVVPEARGYFST